MVDFQQKKKIRKVIYSRITIFVLFVVIIFLFKAVYYIAIKQRISSEDTALVEKDYKSLEMRQNMLKSGIDKLNTKEGIEGEIRGKYSVAKPGETVVVIINSTSSVSTSSDNSSKNIWQKFIGLFK
jgi:cell division protein FtsB